MLNVNICSLVYWLLLLLRKHHSHETHQNLNHKINEAYWKKYKRSEKAEKPKIPYKGEGSISFNQIFIYLLELRTLRRTLEYESK